MPESPATPQHPAVSGSSDQARRPTVVMVRPTDLETDSRAKKIALSLTRLGYDTTVLGRSNTGRRREGRLGAAHVVLVVPRTRLRGKPQRIIRLPHPRLRPVENRLNAVAQKVELRADRRLRSWGRKGAYLFHAAQRDFRFTYGAELLRIQPDIVHVHDPRLLPVAYRAADRIRTRTGKSVSVVYDARENFAGVLETNNDLPAYHHRVLEAERTGAARAAAVLTVSDAVAEALVERSTLDHPPEVLLNTPVWRGSSPPTPRGPDGAERHLRTDAGIPADATVLVYPGAASRARGVDTIVDALPLMPGVHAVLVVVPHPHPRADELMERARELGAGDRLHLVPPVAADDVPQYLSEADVAVHPILAGIPNHEMAMPNKLFEIMHAGLPMASSHVRTMSAFVLEHGMGRVFQAGDPADLARVVQELAAERVAGTAPIATPATIEAFSWQAQETALARAFRRAAPAAHPVAPPVDEPFPAAVVDWA